MKIKLSRQQVQQLQPYIDRVRNAAALGSPGMLVAQVSWSDSDFTCWITPAFLDNDKAKLITEQGRADIPGDLTPGLKFAATSTSNHKENT